MTTAPDGPAAAGAPEPAGTPREPAGDGGPRQPAAGPGGWVRAVPLLVVLAGIAAGLILISMGHWRRGTAALGACAALAGLMRLVLPTEKMGYLVARGKAFDVTFCAALTVIAAVLVAQQ